MKGAQSHPQESGVEFADAAPDHAPDRVPDRTPGRAVEEAFEPRFLVLLHNDDITPYEYVLRILGHVFLLSEELAEHVAWTAHSEGVAIVVVRPQEEARRLIRVAQSHAVLEGYPLKFSMEPEV
jgi:ATP-dependent Clp protease adaptor protein ClpS